MEDGRFDNLPGKGKPLRLDSNPFEDPEWRLAHHVLHSSGYTLPWIDARREIDAALEQARDALRRSWARRTQALEENEARVCLDAEWENSVERFRQQVALINKRIFSYNLEVPSERFQLRQLNVERELELIRQAGK
jgi:DnaJ homolog subfamily C member 28